MKSMFNQGAIVNFPFNQTTYKPKRIYRRPGSAVGDEETRVRTTLLEYGW
jgi:hypothetical protein